MRTRAPGAARNSFARQRPVRMAADVLQEPRADGARIGEQSIHQLVAWALRARRNRAQIFAPGRAQLAEDVGLAGNGAAQPGRDLEQDLIGIDAAIGLATRIACARLPRREMNLDLALAGAQAERGCCVAVVR